MSLDDRLKHQQERAAAERFLTWLNHSRGRSLVICQQRESPDFECKDGANGETVGLEVTGIYYSEHAAKDAWDIPRGKKLLRMSDVCDNPVILANQPLLVNPDEMLADFINERIKYKCRRQYNVTYPKILLLDCRPALTGE